VTTTIVTQQFGWLFVAVAAALGAVPVASAFTNDHHMGRWLYLALAIVSGGAAVLFTVGVLINSEALTSLLIFQAAAYTGAACTWLRMLGVLYR
jgi:uncharacterized membrane protein HdeD (DUF308 family)